MKHMLYGLVIFLMTFFKSQAQWNTVPEKTYFEYSYTKYQISIDNDDTTLKSKSVFTFKLDSIVKLSGNERKLFILSRCINEPLFNSKRKIIAGNLKDAISKDPLIEYNIKEDPSKDECSVFYQNKSVIYCITVPSDFLIHFLDSDVSVKRFDEILLALENKNDILNDYVYFKELNLPIVPFIKLNNLTLDKKNYQNEQLGGNNFYIFSGKKNISNQLSPLVDKYSFKSRKAIGDVYYSNGFGIVRSEYSRELKEYDIVNVVELVNIIKPKEAQ